MSGPQSLEEAAAEEASLVRRLLEGQTGRPRASTDEPRSPSSPSTTTTPSQPPVRSMLDIGEGVPPRNASIASPTARGITFRTPPVPIRSRSQRSNNGSRSAQGSPTEENRSAQMSTGITRHRSQSDASSRPAEFGPSARQQLQTSRQPPIAAHQPSSSTAQQLPSLYSFSNFLSNNPSSSLQFKTSQTGKRISGAMASAMSGTLSGLMGRGDRGRNNSVGSNNSSHAKSKSPHNRLLMRSSSPSLENNKIPLENGQYMDSKEASRRLSDLNIMSTGGALGELAEKNQKRREESGDMPKLARLERGALRQEAPFAESSDDGNGSSDDEGPRGRRKGRKSQDGSSEISKAEATEIVQASNAREPQSLMAAVEGESQAVAAQQEYKSLIDPEITVTSPGDRPRPSKPAVHPENNFDQHSNSGLNTPVDSDAEEAISDIRRARNLAIKMNETVSTPATKRCVKVLYRGDFLKMQQEAQEEIRRVRKYLVAMDLSSEAQHALEWTVGTVLRDGDTLLAIYCVEEKDEAAINEEESQMKAQAAAIAAHASKASGSTPVLAASPGPSSISHSMPRLDSPSASASPAGRERSKLEFERMKYVQIITDRVTQLLRKTKLQVRVVVEVIHTRNSKHLVVEIIDYIEPTMVILGCRGRSQLHSVMLGSFSNYLVTKSSVPVMVARKKLKKHNKIKRPPKIHLANNLAKPAARPLEEARID